MPNMNYQIPNQAYSAHILGTEVTKEECVPIDLSDSNKDIVTDGYANNDPYDNYINHILNVSKATFCFGGYMEQRNWYRRSSSYLSNGNGEYRNIHLGIDIWAPESTDLYMPIGGNIHSYRDNSSYGDYGPTIIFSHNIDGTTFYSLSGHLSTDSLNGINVGDYYERGERYANVGSDLVNGGWPPHLHYQLILDLGHHAGDYPGVAFKSEISFYRLNCPNPIGLLNLLR